VHKKYLNPATFRPPLPLLLHAFAVTTPRCVCEGLYARPRFKQSVGKTSCCRAVRVLSILSITTVIVWKEAVDLPLRPAATLTYSANAAALLLSQLLLLQLMLMLVS
jgi:hypothetical protein